MLKFKDYVDVRVDLTSRTFEQACEEISRKFGDKGVDWYNAASDMKTFIQARCAIINYWDILDFLPAGSLEEFEELARQEKMYFMIDGKKFVKQIDVKDFVKIYTS